MSNYRLQLRYTELKAAKTTVEQFIFRLKIKRLFTLNKEQRQWILQDINTLKQQLAKINYRILSQLEFVEFTIDVDYPIL